MCVSVTILHVRGVGRWRVGRAGLQGGVKEERGGTVGLLGRGGLGSGFEITTQPL